MAQLIHGQGELLLLLYCLFQHVVSLESGALSLSDLILALFLCRFELLGQLLFNVIILLL